MDQETWQRRYERQRRAREKAEALLEEKSLELYRANNALRDLNANLEHRVQQRTDELARINQDLEQQILERAAVEQRLLVTQFSIDRASEPVYWLDSQGRIIYANQAASNALGYSQDELLSKHVFDIDAMMNADIWPSHWKELCRRRSLSVESTHIARDGRRFPVEVVANHIETDGVEYNCAYVRDISERVAARQASARYAELQEIVKGIARSFLENEELTGSIELTLNRLGQYLGVDRAYLLRFRDREQMFFSTHEWLKPGTTSQAASFQDIPISELGWWVRLLTVGRSIAVSDIDAEEIPERVGAALRRSNTRAVLALPVIVNGVLTGMLGFETQGRPCQWDDKDTSPLLTVVEILGRGIERRIAEREREQHRQELSVALKSATRANQAKTVFLANMSHEIRTPLTAIVGYSDMLRHDGALSDVQGDWLAQVRSSATHLSDLINDVLDLSKIEAGELPISTETIDLPGLVRGAVDLVRPLATAKGLQLDCAIEAGTPSQVVTDPKRLKQITINLIQNAVKFTDRGQVSVLVRPDELGLDGQPGFEVCVQDTGIGMSDERLQQVFRPLDSSFYSIAGERGGAGLGLTISRHLAELLHGEITGNSKPNHGTEFVLRLPFGDEPEDAALAKPSQTVTYHDGESLSGVCCLAIDDNLDNQRIIHYLLSKNGAQMTIAGSGREGLELVTDPQSSGRFDVVLLDIQMPGMDGYTTARMMRSEGIELPIIALTAQAMADDRDKCMQSGFDDYVTKPINLDQLTASIRRAIQKGRTAPQIKQIQDQPKDTIRSTRSEDVRFQPLLDAYLKSLVEAHHKINSAMQDGNWDLIRQAAHKLSGTGANYGFQEVSESAKACESLIIEGADVGRKSTGVTDLLSVINRIEGADEQLAT